MKEAYLKEHIPCLRSANLITGIEKGYSNDEKYVADHKFLIRVFSDKESDLRKKEFEVITKLSQMSSHVPKAIDFGYLVHEQQAYMLLSYLPGADAESLLPLMTKGDQYKAGYIAGGELKKLHQCMATSNYPAWHIVKKKKSDRYIDEFELIEMDKSLFQLLKTYINANEHIMLNRPNVFQHDDFHPSNLLIDNNRFSGIIDFQRMDWGDPIHDFHKLGFFSKQISIDFTVGIIDGYHENTAPSEQFWKLYALYSAMHIVSALVWGKKLGDQQYIFMKERALEVLHDHDFFTQPIPRWYEKQ